VSGLYNLYSALFRGEAWPRLWDKSIRFMVAIHPMTFFSLPHFHPDDQSWSLCVIHYHSRPYVEHCRVESTVYTVSQKKTSAGYFCYNFVYKLPIFIIFGNLMLYEICNKVIYTVADLPNLISQPPLPCNCKTFTITIQQ